MATQQHVVESAFDTLDAIKATSKRTEKAKLLADGGNDVIKTLLMLCFDPNLLFGLKTKPKGVKPQGEGISAKRYDEFCDLAFELRTNLSGNAAKDAVKDFLDSCSEREAEWYWAVIRKDLKFGMKAGSINEVFEGLLEDYECMLSHPIKKLPKRFIYDIKFDGYRCNAFHHADGRVELRSRNGYPINGFDHIEAAIKTLPRGYMYDGEIMASDGTFNGTQSIVFKKAEGKEAVLHIFDAPTIDEFWNGGGRTYEERLEDLHAMLDQIGTEGALELVESSRELDGDNPDHEEELYEAHARHVELGFEGTMVKDLDATYERGKGYAIQKIKPFDTVDAVIVDFEKGKSEGRHANRLGAFVVKQDDGELVRVGGGFTDAQRDDFWKRQNEIVNSVIEVEIRGKTSNKKGTNLMRHGVFKRFRPDKD